MRESGLTITNKTHSRIPSVPFLNIKDCALGKKYELSLVFVGEKICARLNYSYRKKNKPANILSFPLNKKNGEIFIALKLAKKESVRFSRKPDNFIAFLFIHGLLHLKGMSHGSTMEEAEKKLRKKFGV